MSNLSDLLPSGGGGKQVDFVASGTIGDGVTVGLNSNGTVSIILEVVQNIGSSVEFDSGQPADTASSYDVTQQKILIAYRDTNNTNQGTAIVGTVSGETISFGTASVFETGVTEYISISYDTVAQRHVISYSDSGNSSYGKAVVATISGTSVSFGTISVFNSAYTLYIGSCYDSTNSKTVIGWRDLSNSSTGACKVATVSGTSISFGTKATLTGSYTNGNKLAFNANVGKFVMSYYDPTASDNGKAVVGTVSGTSITFGSIVTYAVGEVRYPDIAYDPTSEKVILACRVSNVSKAFVGTISGTSISFGAAATFYGSSAWNSITYDSTNNKVLISFSAGANSSNGAFVVGTVSGTSISFGGVSYYKTGSVTEQNVSSFNSGADRLVVAYANSSTNGLSNVIKVGATNNTSFIGISDAAITSAETGSVTIKGGVSTNVTGLTPNTDYYVQANGSISATVSTVPAGKALSSTSILLQG